jgi:hypothetical protein
MTHIIPDHQDYSSRVCSSFYPKVGGVIRVLFHLWNPVLPQHKLLSLLVYSISWCNERSYGNPELLLRRHACSSMSRSADLTDDLLRLILRPQHKDAISRSTQISRHRCWPKFSNIRSWSLG